MAVLNCTMCGGHLEMTADRSIGICECCGSSITFPRINDDQLAAAFNRGNHFRRMGEFDKALSVYERIVQEDDTEAEAHWCCALCRFGIEYVEDPVSLEWIPTCHRASFDSFLEDVDYLAALKYSTGAKRIQYQRYAAKIAEVQRSILATSQNTEAFDVFICYKETDEQGQRTRDSLLAQDIYYQLTEQGRKVFFARITLEDIAGSQYEPYIFAALNSAKVMVVVGTRPEHLNAVWVKNEWSRFLALMRKDHSRLLLPCYRDMDPYDLPEQLSVLQSYDMGKIGFIQDLIRGISKVLSAEKKPEPVREVAAVQPVTNAAALLKRGSMALEDGDWKKADEFFEDVLNQDPECAEAYIGKLLSEEKCRNLDAFAKKRLDLYKEITRQRLSIESDQAHTTAIVKKYVIPAYLNKNAILSGYRFDLTYQSEVESHSKHLQAEQAYWKNSKQIIRAMQFAKGEFANALNTARDQVLGTLSKGLKQAQAAEAAELEALRKRYQEFLQTADQEVFQKYQSALFRREADYNGWVKEMSTADTEEALFRLQKSFKSLEDYRDSAAHAQACEERMKEIKAESEAKRKAQLDQLVRKRKRNTLIVAAITLIVCISFSAIYHLDQLITEKKAAQAIEAKYNSAIEMMEQGKYPDAIKAFQELGTYKDSESKIKEIYSKYIADVSISAGSTLSAGIRSSGTVFITGDNVNGYFDQVKKWTEIVSVSAGTDHIVGLRADGTVVAAGHSNYRHLGEISTWENIIAISAGSNCTVGIKSDGTVIAYGTGYDDQFASWSNIRSISVGPSHTVGLKLDGTVVTAGPGSSECDVSDWEDIIAISAGNGYTIGLKSNGTVVSTNYTKFYTKPWSDIVAISAGYDFAIGLKSDGTVIAIGSDSCGQLDAKNWENIVAISAGYYHVLGLKEDGTVVSAGLNSVKQCEVADWSDIRMPD